MANFLNNIFGSSAPEEKNQEAEKFAKAKKSGMMLSSIFRATMMTYIITVLTNTFGSFLDGIIIGQFMGAECMAAFGLAAPMSIIVFSLSGVFSGGSQSMAGNAMGKGKMDVANTIFNTSVFVAMGLSLIIALCVIIFVNPIAVVLGADPADEVMFGNVTGYVLGIAIGMPVMFGVSVVQPYMHLDNDRPRVIRATLTLSFVNIAGDLANVFFLN